MPGGRRCSVAICKSFSTKAKSLGQSLTFHSFPKDMKLRKLWVQKCYRKDKMNPDTAFICSLHFVRDDYEDAVKADIMNIARKKLIPTAVPSQLLLPSKDISLPKVRPTKFTKEKERKSFVESFIDNPVYDSKEPQETEEMETNMSLTEIPAPCSVTPSMVTEEKILDLQTQNENLRKQNEKLLNYMKKCEHKLKIETDKVSQQQQKIASLENKIKEHEKEANFDEKVKSSFKGILTSNQIDIMLKKKQKARWNQEEMNLAFTIRYFSIRCYTFLRNTLHYPVPGLSTLRQWAGNLHLRDGVLRDVLKIMATAGKTKPDVSRVTILSFDEMKVTEVYEYATKEDEVLGPHSYVQVIMARGLFDNWKQPIYVGFDVKMTQELLTSVIVKLHEINFDVVACVSDCGGGNQALWKELQITPENTHIPHPVTENKIYLFADVPHLLKLLRNWFLDKAFILEDGVVNKHPLEALLKETNSEINACHKLSQLHLNCEKAQRQNVKLAAQLFSHSTAEALKRYIPGNDSHLARRTGEFFSLVNMWFDILNSYTPSAAVPTKRPYGIAIKEQDNILKEMINTMYSMKCCEKQRTLQVFQKGIIISTKSLQYLYQDMKERYNVKYILTHRVNQDCLENFFSQVRTRGGLHDHPSPLNFLDRLRMILLGKNPGIVQKKVNILEDNERQEDLHANYLVAQALQRAHLLVETIEPASEDVELLSDPESTSSGCDTTRSTDIENRSEQDGLLYLAGYLAHKHKHEFPYLGTATHQLPLNVHDYGIPTSWIQSLSYGGLIQPSEKWASEVNKLEHYFVHYNKQTFKSQQDIFKKTTEYITSKVASLQIHNNLIKSFCKMRILLRIKYLNAKRAQRKSLKRSTNFPDRKYEKKMKKM